MRRCGYFPTATGNLLSRLDSLPQSQRGRQTRRGRDYSSFLGALGKQMVENPMYPLQEGLGSEDYGDPAFSTGSPSSQGMSVVDDSF